MSQTVVYGCDWCGQTVEKHGQYSGVLAGEPKFAADVSVKHYGVLKPTTPREATYNVCGQCRDALVALTHGKYRR